MNRILFLWVGLFLIASDTTRTALAADSPTGPPLNVVATLPVLKDFAEQMGGKNVNVTSLLSGLENQHTYTSSPKDILAIRRAGLLLKVGLGLDVWTDTLISNAQNPDLVVVNTSTGIPLMGSDHHADSSSSADDTVGNPHIWLDPENAKMMIRRITGALISLDPSNEIFYLNNQSAYFERLDDLTNRLIHRVSLLQNHKILTHHDAWPYFAHRFGFEIRGHIIPQMGTEPSARHLTRLIEIIKKENIRAIISEPQLSPRFPQILAEETQVNIVLMSPIPGVMEGADDYYSMIKYNVEALVSVLGE